MNEFDSVYLCWCYDEADQFDVIAVDDQDGKKTNKFNGTKECGWHSQLRMCSAAGRRAGIEGETEQDCGCAENVCARDENVNTCVCARGVQALRQQRRESTVWWQP